MVKSVIPGILIGLLLTVFYWALTRGDLAHALGAGLVVFLTAWLGSFALAAIAVRSEHIKLLVATGRIREPSLGRRVLMGILFGLIYGSVLVMTSRSIVSILTVGAVTVGTFVFGSPLLWHLFRPEIEL